MGGMFEPKSDASYWRQVWRRFRQHRIAMAGFAILSFILLLAAIGPFLNGYSYYEQDLYRINSRPSLEHWFGTDIAGRDIFTRTWHGARISLFIGFMAALIDLAAGVLYGGISGIKGGKLDNAMMRIAEILYSIPYLLTAILAMLALGSGLWPMIAAMSLTGWIPTARLIRGQVLQLKEQGYVQAAAAMGAGNLWILRKHIIPNTLGPILVNMALTVPNAIFAEATLSFLGLGIPAPLASLGTMVNDSLGSILVGDYYQLFFPAFLISLIIFCFNAIGEGLRDSLDPRYYKMVESAGQECKARI